MTAKILPASNKPFKIYGSCLNLGQDLHAYAELNFRYEFCYLQCCLADPVSAIAVCHFGGRSRNGMCVFEKYHRHKLQGGKNKHPGQPGTEDKMSFETKDQ